VFTLSEAQVLLPVLEALLRRVQEAAIRTGRLDHEAQLLRQRIHLSGGLHVDVVAAARRAGEREKAAQQAKDTLSEIEQIGVTVQDLGQGLLDFPCQVEGEVVLLCWKLGEATITHWHAEGEEAGERRPLDGRFVKGARERPN
jgi:hypothetical protein